MSRFQGLLFSLRSSIFRFRASADTAEEIRYHVDRQTEKHVAAGHDPASGRRMALAEFGGALRWREETADARAGRFLDVVAQDARYALRSVRRHRAFASLSILTLAIGIGGVTVAGTLVDRVLLRPLPYPDPDRLVLLRETSEQSDVHPFSVPNLTDFAHEARSYSAIGGAMPTTFAIGNGDAVIETRGGSVVGQFFEAVGATPYRGRLLRPADATPGTPVNAMISYELWQRVYGGDSSMIGRQIPVGAGNYTVVGILPPQFDEPAGAQLWTMCRWCPNAQPGSRATIAVNAIGRLRPSVTLPQATAEARLIAGRIHAQYPRPSDNQMASIRVEPLNAAATANARTPLWMLAAAVAFILLIGCANLANANMARNAGRLHELGIRAALGAARRRIIQQLAIESLTLVSIGALLGVGVAWAVLRLVTTTGAEYLPRLSEVSLGADSVGIAVAIAFVVTALIGVLPAIYVSRRDPRRLTMSTRAIASGLRLPVRSALIALEVALSLVLVAGAFLATRSLQLVEAQPIGVDTKGLVSIYPILSRKYGSSSEVVRLHEQAIERLEAVPGIQAAATAGTPPLDMPWRGFIKIEGAADGERTGAQYNLVDEHYFRTAGLPLLRGRLFDRSDDSTSEPVTVIDQEMARHYWPGANPIGKRFKALSIGDDNERWLTVIGVVGNVRTLALEEGFVATHYVSVHQRPGLAGSSYIVVRSRLPAEAIVPAIRQAFKSIDPDLRLLVKTFDDRFRSVTSERRVRTTALASFAAIAALMAAVGIYGVLSYLVALRTREIGIRMALGAGQGRILRESLRQLGPPVLVGTVTGLLGTIALSKVFASLVFNLSPTSPAILASAALSLLVLALAAAIVPARRAARVDPIGAMRAD